MSFDNTSPLFEHNNLWGDPGPATGWNGGTCLPRMISGQCFHSQDSSQSPRL
jgi:hypothetical protein